MPYDWTSINEGPDTWSAFDIIGHLIHGEKTDWIPRARIFLDDRANKTFEPFDRFAQEKESLGKTIEELLVDFSHWRKTNLETLISWQLKDRHLDLKAFHPDLGEVTLRQHLATWTIHDAAHMYQVSRVIVKHYAEDVGPWKKYIRILQEAQ
jgi:hypothetical protein